MGFEALSRGAAHLTCIENGATAHKLIRKNIELLQCDDAVTVLRTDACKLGANKGSPCNILFCDPPYGKGMGARAIAAALAGGWLCENALIVLEENAEIVVPGVTFHDVRRYGDTLVQIGTV